MCPVDFRTRLASALVLVVCAVGVGCPGTEADAPPVGLTGTAGRARYVVTMAAPPPDLAEFRALPKDQPGVVEGYVAKKRAETAAAQARLDAVVGGVGGVVVSRWWMTGQATIEIAPSGLATVRATEGVKSVEPDQALK